MREGMQGRGAEIFGDDVQLLRGVVVEGSTVRGADAARQGEGDRARVRVRSGGSTRGRGF